MLSGTDPHTWEWVRKDINILESVQRRATKLLDSIAHETYEDKSQEVTFNFYSIDDRLRRGDMILIWKRTWASKENIFPMREINDICKET